MRRLTVLEFFSFFFSSPCSGGKVYLGTKSNYIWFWHIFSFLLSYCLNACVWDTYSYTFVSCTTKMWQGDLVFRGRRIGGFPLTNITCTAYTQFSNYILRLLLFSWTVCQGLFLTPYHFPAAQIINKKKKKKNTTYHRLFWLWLISFASHLTIRDHHLETLFFFFSRVSIKRRSVHSAQISINARWRMFHIYRLSQNTSTLFPIADGCNPYWTTVIHAFFSWCTVAGYSHPPPRYIPQTTLNFSHSKFVHLSKEVDMCMI